MNHRVNDWTRLLLVVVLAVAAGAPSVAQRRILPDTAPSPESSSDDIVTTHHQIKVANRILKYTARVGELPIRNNETGEIHGNISFIAYLIDRSPGELPRPLMFLWNGGPGANSVLVHLHGFGPRTVRSNDHTTGTADCECELEDNQTTWLDQADLVFVDPVGTGFSRPTRSEYAAEFYNTLGDIASVAEFVRVYLTRFDAWDAPLFLAGESYGVWRAGGVAETLVQRGRKVAGVILISGGIPAGPVVPDNMRTALFLPTRTAAAFFHKKLSPDLQSDLASTLKQAEAWARTEYAPALAKRDQLNDSERQSILTPLARFTGLDASVIDPKTLIVGRQQFAEQLLRDRKQVLGRFDTREITSAENSTRAGSSLLVNKYLRSTLKFNIDLAYQGIEEGFSPNTGEPTRPVGARWNYNQGGPQPPGTPPNSDSPPGGNQPWLLRAIAIEPSMKAFVAAGLYDSLNSCAGNSYLISQLKPEFSRNITARCYEGGHMMYESPSARQQLKQDIDKFIHDTLANGPWPKRAANNVEPAVARGISRAR